MCECKQLLCSRVAIPLEHLEIPLMTGQGVTYCPCTKQCCGLSVSLRFAAVDGSHLPGGSKDQGRGDSAGGIAADLAEGPVVTCEGLRSVK